jgi:hypothetical protein
MFVRGGGQNRLIEPAKLITALPSPTAVIMRIRPLRKGERAVKVFNPMAGKKGMHKNSHFDGRPVQELTKRSRQVYSEAFEIGERAVG